MLLSATRGLSSVPIDFAAKYTAYTDPWRARRALGVNEGRSCDRSIFPKSRGGPIRRHIKAGRIISNLYCRRIRTNARALAHSLAKRNLSRPHSVSLVHCSLLHAHPLFWKPLCKITSYTRWTTSNERMRGKKLRGAYVDGVGSMELREGETRGGLAPD